MQNNGVREAINWVLTDMRTTGQAPGSMYEQLEAWDRRLQAALDACTEEEAVAEATKRALIRFPQHAKAQEVEKQSLACGNFIVFLMSMKSIFLAKPLMEDGSVLQPYEVDGNTLNRLIAEFFEIDYDAFEREKQIMKQEIRVNEERN